jgi:hypothetical protein
MDCTASTRREFLAGAGGLGVAWVVGNWPGIATAHAHAAADSGAGISRSRAH